MEVVQGDGYHNRYRPQEASMVRLPLSSIAPMGRVRPVLLVTKI